MTISQAKLNAIARSRYDLQNLESFGLPRRTIQRYFVVVHVWTVQTAPLIPLTEAFVCPTVVAAFNLNWNYSRFWLTVLTVLEISVQRRQVWLLLT